MKKWIYITLKFDLCLIIIVIYLLLVVKSFIEGNIIMVIGAISVLVFIFYIIQMEIMSLYKNIFGDTEN